jgi:hypothetical protein
MDVNEVTHLHCLFSKSVHPFAFGSNSQDSRHSVIVFAFLVTVFGPLNINPLAAVEQLMKSPSFVAPCFRSAGGCNGQADHVKK